MQEKSNSNILEQIINRVANFVDIIVNNIKGKSITDIFKFGFSLAIIFLFILIAKLPFLLIEKGGRDILNTFNNDFTNFLGEAWVLIIEFCYLFIAIIAFINIIEKEFWVDEKEYPKTPKKLKKVKEIADLRGFWTSVYLKDKKEIPVWIFISANVIAALVFSAGHLPATQMFFGRITGLILFRCFMLNGSFALFFGRWFRKYGIQYAMLGHFGIHFISKMILICVL